MKRRTTMLARAEEYLATRRKLGFAMKIEGRELLKFARYADESGHRGDVTTDLAVRWAKLPANASPLYCSRRLDIVRRFARYRALFDPKTEVPPAGLLGPGYRRPTPYIYSEEEIAAIVRTCGRLGPVGGLRPHTHATLFGLLASTGLRISEALRLRQRDVDHEAGVITVIETKFHKSRLVPLHPSTNKALRAYAELRGRYYPAPRTTAFFVSTSGTALNYSAVSRAFGEIRQALGWRRHTRRIRDLRHTFATRRLLLWYETGCDLDQKIAALSTYLGHVKVTDTYWYLTAVPELMGIAAARYEREFDPRRRT